jgi:lipoprotein NlpD
MNNKRLALTLVLVATLAACASPRTVAPVVERAPTSRPVPVAKPKPVEAGPGFYVVKKGDTLHRIAQEFNQNFRDLVTWNNLNSPNDIKVDQVLRVLPPEAATAGAQAGSIPASSGVEVRPLGSPASAPATAGTTPASPAAGVASSNKTWPHGEKRPYSEGVLAELQKPDAAPVVHVPRSEAARTAEKTLDKAAEKPADKAADAKAMADDGMAWMWPAEGRVIGTFDNGRKGIDIAGKMGQPVLAAGSGTVLYASSVRGYGNLVIVKHSSNLLSAYAHNKSILVKEGQAVTKGQRIAEMGNSDTDTVKLHFEIRQQGKPVDPSRFLPAR